MKAEILRNQLNREIFIVRSFLTETEQNNQIERLQFWKGLMAGINVVLYKIEDLEKKGELP